MEHLTELEQVFFIGELQVPSHEHNHTSGRARELAIHSGDVVLALLESQGIELVADGLGALRLVALEGEHGLLLVPHRQRLSAGVERVVVVLHEHPAQRVEVHAWIEWGDPPV